MVFGLLLRATIVPVDSREEFFMNGMADARMIPAGRETGVQIRKSRGPPHPEISIWRGKNTLTIATRSGNSWSIQKNTRGSSAGSG